MTRATARRVVIEADVFAALVARLDRAEASLASLAARVALFESQRGPRDASDVRLLEVLAGTIGGRAFTAAELIRHGRVEPRLRAALAQCDADDARRLGKLLARLHGVPIDGRVLRRDKRRGGTRVWHVEHVHCQPARSGMLDEL